MDEHLRNSIRIFMVSFIFIVPSLNQERLSLTTASCIPIILQIKLFLVTEIVIKINDRVHDRLSRQSNRFEYFVNF